MKNTKIEWCDSTCNPVVGCTKGCEYCYARKINDRFRFVDDFSKPQFLPHRLKQLESKKPQIIFMNSMSDIADWELDWWVSVWNKMAENQQHYYLFLTKRFEQFADMAMKVDLEVVKNANIGCTVTKQSDFDLYNIESSFLSIEPMLEPITLYLNDFEFMPNWRIGTRWIILGAETGNRKDKVIPKKEWIDSLVNECKDFGIPVFMKDSLIHIVGEENMLRQFPPFIMEFENEEK
ncbi:DUF5131 family protein [Anaerorhabdus sp.]|uniref:DUF5131 family protein n=1 Tax=Anaerorhabdus sp. TaxID=1872524 RepID=UPI002B20C9B4|nr:DUF5131 family protein [Anaerorhabdus sp.]MEA4875311.1 DUF5131 family protein [Anaerorhabdus sp.]